ncbi:hypothetical protein BDZ94DRAFT_1255855 [Collybia nuda]|uniref:Mediator complex subunit 16 n=1 Tax=Collybia nuda TaxID=64659 RepID=A0A9P5Y9J4_9AGAR|nr:hypothetical protein BDZ94DRAFT_1255855 [Collybia nuda]
MLHDIKSTPLSPSKAKTREKTHWQTGWWDFYPLAERLRKPIEWSQSSILFTAHPTQPLVSGCHFSSSKQFKLPSPDPIVSSPTSYEPPSIISVAPDNEWLFAYFPGRECDGTGCLWKSTTQIDNWTVKEWWNLSSAAGVVAASWLGQARVWAPDHSGLNTRLPPRGPPTPISNPTLLLVTEDHRVNVCYFRQHGTIFKIISSSLLQPGTASERQPQTGEDNDLNNKRCFRAAIGLPYNETSIMIATRTTFLPPLSMDMEPPQYNSSQITFPISIPQDQSLEFQSMEWENWREESTINLCEVNLKFDGVHISLITNPLIPILHPSVGLVALDFISIPPSHTISNNAVSPNQPKAEKGLLYLTAAHLDFGNYTSTPLSSLTIYTISPQNSAASKGFSKQSWTHHKIATREFSPAVLTFVTSSPSLVNSGPMIFAGVINVSGALPTPPIVAKGVSIGTIQVLNLSDLKNNQAWETSPALSKMDDVGQDVPSNAVVSPNGTLICTVSSTSWPVKTSIHLLPRRKSDVSSAGTLIPPLSPHLTTAILSRRPATDITHLLSVASTPIIEIIDTLYQAIWALDFHHKQSSQNSSWGVLGEALVIYRTRAVQATEEHDRKLLSDCWRFAHDMRSLAACNQAFESCRKEDTYDLDFVWQLIDLSGWLVTFTERLMKQCVLSCEAVYDTPKYNKDMTRSGLTLESPILLHLSHPLALSNFISSLAHMNQFRSYLGSLSAGGENAHMTRDTLIDMVDNSGIDFGALVSFLSENMKDCQALDQDECQRGLASCRPTPMMRSHLVRILDKLIHSTIVNKSTLFVRPFDLADSVGRLSLNPKREHDKDVVFKRVLSGIPNVICLYCAGRSDIGKGDREGKLPSRWYVWEKLWALHCVCGGPWAGNAISSPV